MPGLVSDATRVWEVNVYWPMNAQCAVWDVKGKGVDVWECIRPRKYPCLSRPLSHSDLLSRFQTNPPLQHKYVVHPSRVMSLLHSMLMYISVVATK